MKLTLMRPTEVTITHIEICVPVRYKEQDIPNDFPRRRGDMWRARVNIDIGQIIDWPTSALGMHYRLYMKVCDEGTYILWCYFDDYWERVAAIEHDYVPQPVPNSYGDYINLEIDDTGRIANWPKHPDVTAFFKGE